VREAEGRLEEFVCSAGVTGEMGRGVSCCCASRGVKGSLESPVIAGCI